MSEISSQLKTDIDNLFNSVKAIDLNGCTSSNTLLSQIKGEIGAFKKAIKTVTAKEALSANDYFQSGISGVQQEQKAIYVNKVWFKNVLLNKKDPKISINYKKLTSAKIKQLQKEGLIEVAKVDKSGGQSNVEKIEKIFEDAYSAIADKLRSL